MEWLKIIVVFFSNIYVGEYACEIMIIRLLLFIIESDSSKVVLT